jgi:hypothetical protein
MGGGGGGINPAMLMAMLAGQQGGGGGGGMNPLQQKAIQNMINANANKPWNMPWADQQAYQNAASSNYNTSLPQPTLYDNPWAGQGNSASSFFPTDVPELNIPFPTW